MRQKRGITQREMSHKEQKIKRKKIPITCRKWDKKRGKDTIRYRYFLKLVVDMKVCIDG